MIILGVSGDIGSFSEEAGERYAKNHKLNAEIKHLISVENVFKAIERGDVEIGIFPIENSNGGVVFEAINAMANHLFSIKEYFDIEVNHSLIVRNGVEKENIKKIASHDQAFRQCRAYLKRNWPETELVDKPDTAGAAKDLSSGKLSDDTAVIAAARCTQIFPGLQVLEDKIQDLKFNYTAFLAVEEHKEGEKVSISEIRELKSEELAPHPA